jgi:hypothetical protein
MSSDDAWSQIYWLAKHCDKPETKLKANLTIIEHENKKVAEYSSRPEVLFQRAEQLFGPEFKHTQLAQRLRVRIKPAQKEVGTGGNGNGQSG